MARMQIDINVEGLKRISGQLGGSFIEAVNILHDTLDNKGKIVVVGVGKSGKAQVVIQNREATIENGV